MPFYAAYRDIAKMDSGVVTKAEQTSWQNDSMRWNYNAVDSTLLKIQFLMAF